MINYISFNYYSILCCCWSIIIIRDSEMCYKFAAYRVQYQYSAVVAAFTLTLPQPSPFLKSMDGPCRFVLRYSVIITIPITNLVVDVILILSM